MIHTFLFSMCLWRLVDVKGEIETISVTEGDSVFLHTDVNEIEKYLLIQWMFGGTRIAELNRLTQTNSTFDGADGRFRDRLHLDQIGSLTITNTTPADSGLYHLIIFSTETSNIHFNVRVYDRSSSLNHVSSCCMQTNSVINQTEDSNITEHYQPGSDCIYCCCYTEIVIRLVVSALVGVATVAVLVNDIISTRNKLNRTEETRQLHQIYEELQSDPQHEFNRRFSSRYVCETNPQS